MEVNNQMTKKHFKQIANAIKDLYLYDSKYNNEGKKRMFNNLKLVNKTKLIDELSIVFKKLNPRFNKQTFVSACNDTLNK